MAEINGFARSKATPRVIFLVGVPGAGKSTITAQLLREYPDAVVVNRDDLRTAVAGAKYHNGSPDKKVESQVTVEADRMTVEALRAGKTIINDNTNTNPKFLFKGIQQALNYGASVDIRTIDVPLAEAKRRNALRGASGGRLVPDSVIDRMGQNVYSADGHIKDVVFNDRGVFFVDKYTPGMRRLDTFNALLEADYPILGSRVAIVDLDGTLAFNHELIDRYIGALGPNDKKDWDAFYNESSTAPVNTSVLELVRKLRAGGLTVFAITGRVDGNAESTIEFVQGSGAPISRLIMARAGDYRGDYAVKKDAVASLEAEGFVVVHAIDDRPSSIRVWDERGISVSRVPFHEVGLPQESYVESTVDDITGQGFCLVCGGDLPEGELLHDNCGV